MEIIDIDTATLTDEKKIERILELKHKQNAVILAHYYQDPAIQDIADYIGDSLALSQYAQKVEQDVILFCGVNFMAETAKILNPNKKVIVPDLMAGCSLADSAPADEYKQWIDAHPNSVVVSYINTSAEVKALSDIICTSSNAIKIVNSIPTNKQVLFGPDKFLGSFVKQATNRDIILWDGACIVHQKFSEEKVKQMIAENPDAEVLAHPECPPNILKYADIIGSTTKIISRAVESNKQKFIILTEPGVIHQMKKLAPDKIYLEVPDLEGCSCNMCPFMRLNTLDKIIAALENLAPEVNVREDIRQKALLPIKKMLELS
ncbi:MAG TPA: quinolinate synthase NadA [Candidatus Kapabacteria bacterium]|nr:quinolinate synthase NadA [Candidatus Kapabacteria bacterium]